MVGYIKMTQQASDMLNPRDMQKSDAKPAESAEVVESDDDEDDEDDEAEELGQIFRSVVEMNGYVLSVDLDAPQPSMGVALSPTKSA